MFQSKGAAHDRSLNRETAIPKRCYSMRILGCIAIFVPVLWFATQHQGSSAVHRKFLSYTVRAQSGRALYDLTYVSNASIAEELGCPLDHEFACFYRFTAGGKNVILGQEQLVSEADCTAFLKPLPVDNGRPWCIREVKRPIEALSSITEERQWEILGPVLLTGSLDSPNPTHQHGRSEPGAGNMQSALQANLHFLAIWKWMTSSQIHPGQLQMLVDSSDHGWAPGTFGTGLATALGDIKWLPQLEPGIWHFEQIQFSIPGGQYFPFDLKHYTMDLPLSSKYLELAENVKFQLSRRYTPSWSPTFGEAYKSPNFSASPTDGTPHAVIAQRKPTESRFWENTNELASHLTHNYNMSAEVMTLGDLSFDEQVKAVASADVLVGLTGSDLVNLMFLPPTGSVIEVFPSVGGQTIFVPELANMARLLGKNHFSFVSTGYVEVDASHDSAIHQARRVHVPVPELAALIFHAAHQARTGSELQHTVCRYAQAMVKCSPKP